MQDTKVDWVGNDHLNELLGENDTPCVSIYLPMHTKGVGSVQNSTYLKNGLREAETQLRNLGKSPEEIANLLKEPESWIGNYDFWQHQSHGLAVFLSPNDLKAFRLPIEFEMSVRVGDHFHLRPLLPVLQRNGRFYLLNVSQNHCSLMVGDRTTLSRIELPDLPKSLESALGWEHERQLNLHSMRTSPQPRGTSETAMYHGHDADQSDEELTAYFRRIDDVLETFLKAESSPLIFAGVESLFPLYQQVNTYPHLCDQIIAGNQEHTSDEALHHHAWRIVEPQFTQVERDRVDALGPLKSREKASDDPEVVLAAARHGLIETLLVANKTNDGSDVTPNQQPITSGVPESDRDDLIDQAVADTLRTSGEVIVIDPEHFPDDTWIASLLRAPITAIPTSVGS